MVVMPVDMTRLWLPLLLTDVPPSVCCADEVAGEG